MTIQEIIDRHKIAAFTGADTACSCDRTWRTNTEYRAHVAEVLDKYMQEQCAEAWDEGQDSGFYNGRHCELEGFVPFTNPYRKDTRNGS